VKTGLILIDVESYMSSVSLVEAGRLKEYYVEDKDASYITGNIYKGRVVNMLTGLQSAFVNFGSARNGFLSVEETLGHKSVFDDAGVIPKLLDVKEGDYVMVQATKEEIETIRSMAFKVNELLAGFFKKIGLDLIDFKLEFGRYNGRIILADEISPDTCRLWDSVTHEKLDKDRFRRDLGGVEEAYEEVMRRLAGEAE